MSWRARSKACIAMADIDYFKKVNDTYGHVTGDHALRALAQLIEKRIRKSDTFCRFGGEEFVLLFPNTEKAKGFELVEAIRQEVAETEFEISEDLTLQFSFSGGITECHPGEEMEAILEVTDKKLYQAKQSGRNQVVS